MSEANFWIHCRFKSKSLRDQVMAFLIPEGRPDFEDEVAEEYQALFSVMEEVEIPILLKTIDDNGLEALFVIGGGDAYDRCRWYSK